jgi:hypothetical protein
MSTGRTDEFRKDTVRMVLTSFSTGTCTGRTDDF